MPAKLPRLALPPQGKGKIRQCLRQSSTAPQPDAIAATAMVSLLATTTRKPRLHKKHKTLVPLGTALRSSPMLDLITVAALATELDLAPVSVQARARKCGIAKISGVYIFTPEQAERIRQCKSKPGPSPLPEDQITRSAKSKRMSRAKSRPTIDFSLQE